MHLDEQATQPSKQAYRTHTSKRTPIEPSEESIRDGYRLIPLTRGMVAVVDERDYDWLMQWPWYANPNNVDGVTTYYARRDEHGQSNGKKRVVLMHRFIMDASDAALVDHRDHDGLNCRRMNLRIATRAQNNQNVRSSRKRNAHGLKGVHYDKERDGWRSKINVDGKTVLLGRHKTKEAAAEAYRVAAIRYFGEFACSETLVGGDTIKGETA